MSFHGHVSLEEGRFQKCLNVVPCELLKHLYSIVTMIALMICINCLDVDWLTYTFDKHQWSWVTFWPRGWNPSFWPCFVEFDFWWVDFFNFWCQPGLVWYLWHHTWSYLCRFIRGSTCTILVVSRVTGPKCRCVEKNGTIMQERLATRSVVEKRWHKLWIHLFRCLQSLRCQRRPEATRSVRLLLYLSDYGWNVLKDRRWHECLWLFLCFCCRSTGKKSRRGLSVCWC